MNRILPLHSGPPAIKPAFGGYRTVTHKDEPCVDIFLPGHADERIRLEYLVPDDQTPKRVKMFSDGQYLRPKADPFSNQDNEVLYHFVRKMGDGSEEVFVDTAHTKTFFPFLRPKQHSTQNLYLQYFTVDEYGNQEQKNPEEVKLAWNGTFWELAGIPLEKNVILHQVIEKRKPDFEDKTIIAPDKLADIVGKTRDEQQQYLAKWTYNAVPANSSSPRSWGGTSLVMLRDSLVPKNKLENYIQTKETQNDNVFSKRTHFNKFGGQDASNPFFDALCKNYGITGLDERPFGGGDKVSGHGYWTRMLPQFSGTISTLGGFEDMMLRNLKSGVRVFWDFAGVNEVIDGPHASCNLLYKEASPYIDWIYYGPLNAFPHQKLKAGVLPVKTDPDTKLEVPNPDAWDIRILNRAMKPATPQDTEGPFYVQLYDPRLENADGSSKPLSEIQKKTGFLTNSQASVQSFCFPISKEEYKEKIEALKKASTITDAKERHDQLQNLKMHWQSFNLVIRAFDNSGEKWDGQADVIKLKMDREDVQNYLRSSCRYWTDKVDRLYTQHVASALVEAAKNKTGSLSDEQWVKLIQDVTQSEKNPNGILPALEAGETQPITASSIHNAFREYRKQRQNREEYASEQICKELQDNFHLEQLPGPPHFQALLASQDLKHIFVSGYQRLWFRALTTLLTPVFLVADKLFPKSKPGSWLNGQLQHLPHKRKISFQGHLKKSLIKMLEKHPKLEAKLQDPVLCHLVHEAIGRSIMLSLFTGKFVSPDAKGHELDEKVLAEAYAKNIPGYITESHPAVAARYLNDFVIQELVTKGDKYIEELAKTLEKRLANLTPEACVAARHILHQRRLGVHWRIDAMKDFGDMNRAWSQPNEELRIKRLETKEFPRVRKIVSHVFDGVREIFPKSIVRGEVTDLDLFVAPDKEEGFKTATRKQYRLNAQLLGPERDEDENTRYVVNGAVNYPYWFASGLKAVRASRKDREGANQLSPAQFINDKLVPMMQELPVEQVYSYQNTTSNQDKAATLNELILHPNEARYDYQAWIGLNKKTNESEEEQGIFYLALDELHYKPQIKFMLSQPLPDGFFDKLKELTYQPKVMEAIEKNPVVKRYLSKNDGIPIPIDIKRQYIDLVFSAISPEDFASDLNITPQRLNEARQVLKSLMAEPSEMKALRGKLYNSLELVKDNPSETLQKALGKNKEATTQLLQAMTPAFHQALWELKDSLPNPDQDWRWLGNQSVDIVVDWTFRKLADAVSQNKEPYMSLLKAPGLKEAITNIDTRRALSQGIYNKAVEDALELFTRIAALEIILPGDPNFDLHDLLGQSGREDPKLKYLGNRELYRYDWLDKNSKHFNPQIKAYHDKLAQYIGLRKQLHVLNTGTVELPLDTSRPGEAGDVARTMLNNAEKSIMPIIRDNGQDQVICLVNFGNPQHEWNTWADAQKQPQYADIKSQNPRVSDYKLPLKYMGIATGTMYKSVDPEAQGEERYGVNASQELVKMQQNSKTKAWEYTNQGVDIHIARMLLRVPDKA